MKVNACVKCGTLFVGRNDCPVCKSNQFEILSLKSYDEGVEAFTETPAPPEKPFKFPSLNLKFRGMTSTTKSENELNDYLEKINFHHYKGEIVETLKMGERKFSVGNRVSGFLDIEARD